jgi:uncharacterized protein YdeI (YjbR/CyaY-like superfamily)
VPIGKPKPVFFESAAALRRWFEAHHADAEELWVGYHKRGTGQPSLTWQESVEQALCFGWIDGIRKSLDERTYTNRFTPRKAGSNWSAINIAKVEELEAAGLMRPAGRQAFGGRKPRERGRYSHERRGEATLTPAFAKKLRANARAWKFFEEQAPWYRRTATWWVMDAKKEETRERRLATLITDSAAGRRIGPLAGPAGAAKGRAKQKIA